MKNKENTMGANKQMAFLNTTKLAVLSAMLLLAVFCTIGMSFTPAEEGENVGNPNDSTYITGPRRSHWTTGTCGSTTYNNETDYAEVHAQVIVWDNNGDPITNNPSEYGSVTLSGTPIGGSASDGTTYSAKISATKPETNPINAENLNGSSVSIKWNSGEWTENSDYSGNNSIIIKNRHTLNVAVKANVAPESDYEFYGWTKVVEWDGNTTPTTKPNTLYNANPEIKESIIIGDGKDGFVNYNSNENKSYTSGTPHKVIYYAHFAPPAPVNITLNATETKKDSYIYSYTDSDGTHEGTISSAGATITTSAIITLTATPASDDYKFFGWYEKDGDKEKYLSYESPWSKKFTVPTTIYAKFIPSNAALFIIKDDKEKKQFWNLNEACDKALTSSKVVLPKDNGTLYPLVDGELCKSIPEDETIKPYTIPSGVTLWIPHSDNSEPKGKNVEQVLDLDFIAANCKVYRFLTLSEGVTIIANGNIEVSAQQVSKQQSSTPKVGNNGAIYQGYGEIIMQKGSKINLQSGAYLYAWGRVTGSDESLIKAYQGAVVYESFQITDYQGGSRTKAMYSDRRTYKIFPFSQYYIQNIETPLRFEFGAKEYANAILTTGALVGDGVTAAPMNELPIIGNGGSLFNINSENSYVEKRYDAVNDRQVYKIGGTTSVDNFSTSIRILMDLDIKTEDYLLPFTNNIVAHIESGELTINANLIMNADNKVTVDSKAKVIIATGKSLFVYDKDDWKTGFVFASSPNTAVAPLCYTIPYATTTGKPATVSSGKFTANPPIRTTVEDATLQVDGELIVNGNLYVSPGLANICSTGAGKVTFPNGNTCSETYTVHHLNAIEGNMLSAKITSTYTTLFIPAQLHNDESKTWNQDDEYKYTPTAGAEAGDEFTYSETYGRWRCERTITWDANGGTIEPTTTIVGRGEPLSLYFSESLPIPTKTGYTFNGWFTDASGGDKITTGTIVDKNVTYYAQWKLNIEGTPLDIVDADGTYLTINANGWASSGWPYTINGTPYEKTARQPDRTLVIPYDGNPNDDMAIEVKNHSDKVISNHSYKVPFVYTGKEDMSAMNNNSIVFVKSGTLTIEDNISISAKEIYVAPGAELKVNGTLTVGKLVLRTTPFDAAILTNNGTIAGQVYYSRIARDTDFHLFAIPAGSNTADVVLSDGTSAAVASTVAPYGNAWQLREYNTARRAEEGVTGPTGTNWDNIGVNGDGKTYSDVDIEASKGYELRSGSKYYREYLFPVTLPTTTTSVGVTAATGAAGAADAGWNILCSPYTDVYKVEYDPSDPTKGITVSWQQPDGSYTQVKPTVIPPAIPFAYQASEGEKKLYFSVSSTAAAPRKQSAAEALTETEWVHLDIFDAYGEGDETSLFVHPTRFEQTYKTGIDVAKQSLTAARPIIYSTHAYGDMAFAGIADSLLENGIDLVVYNPSAQELTFSLRENKFLNRLEYLWLADNETGARTDLLMDDYTCRANAGTTKGRFVLNGRFKAPQISTGITNTQTDYNIYAIGNNIAISGVEQGTPIYVFDAVGHMIYTTSATSDEVIVPAPCAGVYMLTIGGQTAKLVINQ